MRDVRWPQVDVQPSKPTDKSPALGGHQGAPSRSSEHHHGWRLPARTLDAVGSFTKLSPIRYPLKPYSPCSSLVESCRC